MRAPTAISPLWGVEETVDLAIGQSTRLECRDDRTTQAQGLYSPQRQCYAAFRSHDWTAATRRSDRQPEGSDNGHLAPSHWSATGTCGSARGRLCGTRTAEQELTEQPAAVNRNEGRRVLAIGQTPTEHRFATAASAGDHLGSRIAWRATRPSFDPQVGHNLCWCTIRQYKRIGHTIGQWHLARRPQIARWRPLVQNFGMPYGGPRWMTSAQWRERMPCS